MLDLKAWWIFSENDLARFELLMRGIVAFIKVLKCDSHLNTFILILHCYFRHKVIFWYSVCFSCFLSAEPRLLAFYAPVCVVVLINIVLYLCMCRSVYSKPPHAHTSSSTSTAATGTDATTAGGGGGEETEEMTDLEEVVESTAIQRAGAGAAGTGMGNNHAINTSLLSDSGSVMDLEYRPVTQLRGLAFLLFLYIVTWTSGGFAVALPYPEYVPHQELVFNVIYAVSSASLGFFILIFYVFVREDCRICWQRACGCRAPAEAPPLQISSSSSNHHTPRANGIHHQALHHHNHSSIE